MNLGQIVMEMVNDSISSVKVIGKKGKENIESEKSKRTCIAEKLVYDKIRSVADRYFDSYKLMTEGFEDFIKGKNSNLKIVVDPMDGTAYYVRQNSINGFPVSVVVSIMDGEKYKDVKAAAIGDLQTGEIWYATNETGAISESEKGRRNVHVGGNEEHDPIWASDFYFPENAKLRTRLSNPKNPKWDRFECLNVASVAEQGAKIACGEIDLFYNLVGPKGYELAAMYRLIKQADWYCLHLPTGKELGKIGFEFNDRVPVVLAKDKESAGKVLEAYHAMD